jgi:hypothetical protein
MRWENAVGEGMWLRADRMYRIRAEVVDRCVV